MLVINWFYKKHDIQQKKFENLIPHLSENEIFETDHQDLILADSIDGPANVVTLD